MTRAIIFALILAAFAGQVFGAVDDEHTVVLLHFDGGDEGSTFTDESGKEWTQQGTVYTDQGEKVFGNAAARFDFGGYITCPDHSDFDIGTGPFTFDYRYRPVDGGFIQDPSGLLAHSEGAYHAKSWQVDWNHTSGGMRVFTDGMSNYCTVPITWEFETKWYHVAIVRDDAGTVYYFLDGFLQGTAAFANTFPTVSGPFYLGYQNVSSWYSQGWIDEFRFSKVARWTSGFTPPTEAYGPSTPARIAIATSGKISFSNNVRIGVAP